MTGRFKKLSRDSGYNVASPQCENGYFKVANELAEAFARSPFNGREFRLLLSILRRTYGFNKKADKISFGQLAEDTGLDRRNVIFVVNSLVSKKTLVAKQNGKNKPLTYQINKDYEAWTFEASVKNDTSSSSVESNTKSSVEFETTSSVEFDTHKRHKDKKDIPTHFFEFSEKFLRYQQKQLGDALVKITETKIKSGAEVIEKLIRIDGFDLEKDIRPVLHWAVDDDFWSNQIRSLAGLRKQSKNGESKFANLVASYRRNGNRNKIVEETVY